MIPLAVAEWIGPRLYKLIGCSVVVLMGMSACMIRDASIKNAGAAEATTTIEKATTNAAQNGAAAARKSITVGVRGKRDPTTRDD